MDETLTSRIQRMEDIEAIRRLKWDYCNLADRGWPLAGIDHGEWAALFTEDAVYDTNGATPTFHSRAELDSWNRQLGGKAFSFHLVGNGTIAISGDTATGKWHSLTPVSDPERTMALWSAGVFEDRFRRTADGWRIMELRFRPAFVAAYQGTGWV